MIKIKYVKEPLPEEPGCQACYDTETKSIWIRKYTRKSKIPYLVRHEMGHYYIDILFSIPRIKHYLNLLWEYIWIIFDFTDTDKIGSFSWYYKYYHDRAKIKDWCY